MRLFLRSCEECGRPGGEDGMKGWRALLGVNIDDDEPESTVHVFCPECAEREFGPAAKNSL